MGLTCVMLVLLLGCYAVCGALVLFAENVIRPRVIQPAGTDDVPRSHALPKTGAQ